jgi:hypothetical protein
VNEENMQRLKLLHMDIDTKFQNSEMALNEKVQLMRKTLYEYEQKMKQKADKEYALSILNELREARMNYDK